MNYTPFNNRYRIKLTVSSDQIIISLLLSSIFADGSCGIDQDSVLEELLGKVKSNKVASNQSAHPFKRPDVAMSQNVPFNEISTSKNNQIQNPFRKSTGIKRSLKEVAYLKIT